MRGPLLLIAAIVPMFAISLAAQRRIAPVAQPAPPGNARRIVSIAPSLTETLFALGLGDRVVGVSRYCDDPPEAQQRPAVGGYFDLNLEAVVGLRPDLIVMLDEHAANLPALEKLGFATLVVNHQTVDGVLDSLLTLGAAGGAEEAAARLHAELNQRRRRVVEQTAGLARPRVLLVVDRSPGGGIEDCYVAGQEDYFDTMIGWAGGQNACRASLARYPVVSREGIIWMDPEVIVDLSRGLDGSKGNDIGDWQSLGSVSAVRHGRVWSLEAPYAFRPGPRFIVLLERLAEIIHRPAPAAEAAQP